MPNWLKLQGGFLGFYLMMFFTVGLLFVLMQTGVMLDQRFGSKQIAAKTQVVDVVIVKDNKVFKKQYELSVQVNEDGEFYNARLTTGGEKLE